MVFFTCASSLLRARPRQGQHVVFHTCASSLLRARPRQVDRQGQPYYTRGDASHRRLTPPGWPPGSTLLDTGRCIASDAQRGGGGVYSRVDPGGQPRLWSTSCPNPHVHRTHSHVDPGGQPRLWSTSHEAPLVYHHYMILSKSPGLFGSSQGGVQRGYFCISIMASISRSPSTCI